MLAPLSARPTAPLLTDLHTRFLKMLPRIELHGRIFFRNLRCQQEKTDAIAEMVALAWKWYVRLAQRGKDAADFVVAFCRFLGVAVKSGRKITGLEKAKDVMNPINQQRRGFKVERLPASTLVSYEELYSTPHGQERQDAFEERLRHNTISPVPEQVAFRIDWPAWMRTRTERDRRIINDLMNGERTFDVSRRYGISPGRVSQLRQEYHEDWLRFNGDNQQLAYAA
jgi:hypothetical protein